MASTLTDGTYMIRFSTMPTKTGMYRYDVYIDNELVFIGNTYLEGNKNPIIDINDIVMNYNEPLHPKSYGTIAQKSKLLRTVKIKLYLDEPSEIESQVLMIYENPYYNSKVTTPILDNWVTNSIGEMPMLQGWNSSNQNGVFIPTYPAVATPNFTFDYLASKENLPLYHSFNVKYSGGKVDSGVQNFTVPDMSVFQITQPLQWLLRGVNTTKPYYEKPEKLIKNMGYYATEYTTHTETGAPCIGFTSYSSLDFHDRFSVGFSKAANATSTEGTDGDKKTWHVVVEIDEDNVPYGTTYEFYTYFRSDVNSSTSQNKFLITPAYHDQLIATYGSYKMHFYATHWHLSNGLNPYYKRVQIAVEVAENVYIPVCEAEKLNMLVFSPVNAAVKYEMTVAKFDNKSRFFLKWKDRYGMVQCQPFSGTELYEENFEKTHTKNFKHERKLVQISNQPKWKLNSNWINQDLYPFYESIFVSPWLQLYDAKFDKLYEVLLTENTYTEKTFKNQGRQLFNIQLEVEQSKTQNMLF